MTKKIIFLLVAILFFVSTVQAIPVERLTITSGSFSHDSPILPGSTNSIPFHTINMDLVMGTFQGSPVFDLNGAADPSAGIASIEFGGGLTGGVFTTSASYGYDPPLLDQNPAPSGDVSNGILTLNLDAWAGFQDGGAIFNFVPAYGSYFETTYNPVTQEYTADWETYMPGGPWVSQYWHLEGLVHLTCQTDPDCDDGNFCAVGSCLDGNCVYDPIICPGGGECDPVLGCTCPFSENSVTIRGGGQKPTSVDLQIQTSFTALQGCILDYNDSTVTVTTGAVLKVDWYQGNGPDPTVVWLDGELQPGDTDGVINFPEVTAETRMVLKATNKAQVDTPLDQPVGKDTDRMTIKIVP